MCEKRTIRRSKKGSQKNRLREARRLQRLQRLVIPSIAEDAKTLQCPSMAQREAQSRALIELALKTAALMQKNKLIQEKIDSLKKETSEFVATVMSNPENRRRYLDNIRIYSNQVLLAQEKLRRESVLPFALTLKLEPKV